MRKNGMTALLVALAGLAAGGVTGCYYLHLAEGQWRVLRASRDIEAVLADPDTPEALHHQLVLVGETRAFAARLGLAVDDQYTSYLPWPGDRIVTSVVATRPGEIDPAGFTFPVVGTVPYKGFFDRARAEAEAARLRRRGLDVCVLAVPAYSTLGWLDDPVTEPMVAQGDAYLVETLIHELVHATVYAPDAADFNEGLATFVGQEGAVRFFGARGRAAPVRAGVADERAVQAVLSDARAAIAALYAETEPGPARDARREAITRETRARLAALDLATLDAAHIALHARLNDACLSIAGTYWGDLPRYAAALAARDGDLRALVEAAERAARADDPRAALLGPTP
jgi:predicted aminopeptidase